MRLAAGAMTKIDAVPRSCACCFAGGKVAVKLDVSRRAPSGCSTGSVKARQSAVALVLELLTAMLVVGSCLLHMRITEGSFFVERLASRDAAVSLSVAGATLILSFVVVLYPGNFVTSVPDSQYLLVFAVGPALGCCLLLYPECVQPLTADSVTLRWAEVSGWVVVIGLFLL